MADNHSVNGIRYSAISAMHSCLLNAWLIYGPQRLEGKQNKFAKMGICIHDVLEDYGRHCLGKKIDTDFEQFDKIKFKHMHLLEEDQLKEANEVFDEIKSTFNWNTINEFPNVMIEKRFKLDINFNPTESDTEWYLSGAIDIVYDDTEILFAEDYKSVRSIYTKAFMSESLQRKIYCLLLFKHYPHIDTIKFAFNFVRYGYRSEWIIATRENLEALEIEVRAECDAFEELMASKYPPLASPSGFCILCPVPGKCPMYGVAFDATEKIETMDEAKELYQKLVLAKIKTKSMEDMLKWYINHNSPLEFKNETYGPQIFESTKYSDPGKLMDLLRDEKIPEGAILDMISTNKTNVEKVIKKFKLADDLKKKIYGYSTKEFTTKFVAKKKQDERSDEEGSVDPYL